MGAGADEGGMFLDATGGEEKEEAGESGSGVKAVGPGAE